MAEYDNTQNTGSKEDDELNRTATGENYRSLDDNLTMDSTSVTQEEIDALGRDVPKKLKNVERMRGDVKEGMEWLGTMIDRVKMVWQMVSDKSFKLEGKAKALIIGALLYFVLPTDLTPDFIPGIGYIDDAIVLSTLWKTIEEQVERYMAFMKGGITGS